MRTHYLSGVEWEDTVGYSRVVRVGNIVEISGTTATDDTGAVVGKNDSYLQTVQTLENIGRALEFFDLDFSDVIRTRMFVTDISRWEEYGKAHGEKFHTIKPATSMVEVSALIDPEMMIEIEATAIISDDNVKSEL